jgi:flagellar basal-body rod modification protein FlgD
MIDIVKTSNLTNLGTTTGTRAQSGTADSGATATAGGQSADDLRNQFLGILLTQMQNQNPLDPMDTKEFTGQLAQFSSLEQQINTNSKLDNLVTAMNSNASTAAFNYIGQTAEVDSKMSIVEDGKLDWKYTVPSNVDNLTLKVKDSTGKVVYSKDIKSVESGTYNFSAETKDLDGSFTDGQILTFEVSGKDANGKNITSNISTTVKVDGIESSPTGIDLRAGGLLFSLDDVLRFKTNAPSNSSQTTAEAA